MGSWTCPDCGRRWGTPATDCSYCRPAEIRRESAAPFALLKQWTYHGLVAPSSGPLAGEVAMPLQIRWRAPMAPPEPSAGSWTSLHRLAQVLAADSGGAELPVEPRYAQASARAIARNPLPARRMVLSAIALGVLATMLAILTQLR